MLKIHSGVKVIGVDGVYVGTVDAVADRRIKLTKGRRLGAHKGHTHYIDEGLVADVDGNSVRLSANAAVDVCFEEEYCREWLTSGPLLSRSNCASGGP
jgi:hypothetical protein